MATGFEFATRGTIAEGAKLAIEPVQAQVWCMVVNAISIWTSAVSVALIAMVIGKVETGDELMIKNIEVE